MGSASEVSLGAAPESQPASPTVEPVATPWWKRVWTFPLGLFVFTRIAYLGMSYMGMELVPFLFMHDEGRNQYMRQFKALDGLCRWDCGWFVRLVNEGYATIQHAAVWPLFPAVGWAVERVTGLHHVLVFLLLANVVSLGSYYAVYKIFRELEGDDAARWGLMLFAAYPFAYYQAAGYAESAVVLSTAGAMLLAKRNHYYLAGLVLGLGTMSRQLSLLGGAGLVAIYVRQRGWNVKKLLLDPALLGFLIPWAFVGAFAYYLKVKLGDPLAFVHGRNVAWNEWVWYGVREMWLNVPYLERPEYYFYAIFVLVPVVGTVALFFKRSWLELAACSAAMMAMSLSIGAVALGRYSAPCWPAYLPLGLFLSRRPALQAPVLSMFMLFQGFYFFLFSHQFRIL